jgi:negative regulator of genetic competence, sporulation and motility
MSNAEAYITLFFQDLETLNHCLALYLNILIPIKDKYKLIESRQGIINEINEDDANDLKDITKEIRYSCVRINTKLKALQSAFPDLTTENKAKLDANYQAIITSLIPKYETVDEYITELNKLFITGTGNQLLVKSNQYYTALTQSNNISGYDGGVVNEEQQ